MNNKTKLFIKEENKENIKIQNKKYYISMHMKSKKLFNKNKRNNKVYNKNKNKKNKI